MLAGIFCVAQVAAQNRTVTGVVTSDADNAPLAGVTVVVKGTQIGVTTDLQGRYRISAPAEATLEFSFIGMEKQDIPVGNQSTINVTMRQAELALEQVVVTAMGIARAERSLGYSTSTVRSEDLEKARESNVINSLQGKVAGVNVTSGSGTPGGGSKIIIRGQSSLGSSGQPIFVIDGMPVSNSSYNPATISGNVDAGTRIGDIATDDIGSISILKGAAATALYGARAKDGAIIITTKKGSKHQQTTVTVNSTYRMDRPLVLPNFQNEYAGGIAAGEQAGEFSATSMNGWGPLISSMQDEPVRNYMGDYTYLRAYPDNVKDFYDTGHTIINSISVSGGDDKNDFRLGFTANNQTGIIPGNKYDKYNVTFNGGRQFNEKFTARATMTYAMIDSEGLAAQGSNDANVLVPLVNGIPRTMSMNLLRDNWINAEGRPYTLDGTETSAGKTGNPFWNVNQNVYSNSINRFTGSAILSWTPFKNLTISNNAGLDYFVDKRRAIYAKYTVGKSSGGFNTYGVDTRILNNDLIATYTADLGAGFGLKVIGGHNVYENFYTIETVTASSLLLPGIYSYSNAETKIPTNSYYKTRLVGVYGDIGLSYKDMAYINVTGRNDWSSTMPKSNQSYFYPSVSGSFIFTELIPKNKVLDYGKFRINYANVGSDTNAYVLDYVYRPVSTYYLQFFGTGNFPHGDLLAYGIPQVYPNPNIQPQNQSAFEVGGEFRFFSGRLILDGTYYYNTTTRGIASVDIANSTGYFAERLNIGKVVNKGVELVVGVTPVRGKVRWDVTMNFAANKQIVKELHPSIKDLLLTSGWTNLQIKAAAGESYSIYGYDWARDPDGNIIMDETGLRTTQASPVNLGKTAPDWTMGLINNVSYMGFNLGFVIDIRQGGVMYSGTVSDLRTSGLAAETAKDRGMIIDKGVVDNGDGTYSPNTTAVLPSQFWSNYTVGNTSANIFNASYVKLRELSLSYVVPKAALQDFFIKNIQIGLEARNLWIIKKHVPHIDPEVSFFDPGAIGSGVEFASVPSTRSIGFNLRFSF